MKEFLYDWYGANVTLFHWINGIDGPLHDSLMLLGTLISSNRNLSYYLAAIAVCALWQVHREARKPSGAMEASLHWLATIGIFSVAYAVDSLLVLWIKTTLAYPRPLLVLPPDTIRVLGEAEYKLSFPSGHASFAMVLVASLWPRLGTGGRIIGTLFLVWVGLSRISAGAHFPTDVVGSYLFALPVVLAVQWAVNTYLAKAMTAGRERS